MISTLVSRFVLPVRKINNIHNTPLVIFNKCNNIVCMVLVRRNSSLSTANISDDVLVKTIDSTINVATVAVASSSVPKVEEEKAKKIFIPSKRPPKATVKKYPPQNVISCPFPVGVVIVQ